jgi:hypothetical protein
MTKNEVVELMKSSRSEHEWNLNCDKVQEAFGGQYPDFWYAEIILSGLLSATSENWEKTKIIMEEARNMMGLIEQIRFDLESFVPCLKDEVEAKNRIISALNEMAKRLAAHENDENHIEEA